ncbi:Os11g0308800, partial [Oryza sativa Japonica Group]
LSKTLHDSYALIIPEQSKFYLYLQVLSISKQEEREQVLDPVVLSTSSQDSLSMVISITVKCLSVESSARPSIEEVLWNLQYAAQVQAISDGDQRSEVSSQTC